MKEAKKVLKEVFGYDHFRADQEQIIQHILRKKDALVLMPTGGGKSICFQIPALLFDGVALVISPLISLMKDQVESLLTNGVPAAYLNSSQSESEKQDVLNRAQQNELKLLYISPETLMSGIQTWMREIKLSMVAIDEAHCVSMWGHDFRPEYTMIRELRNQFSEIPFVALTATADKLTKKDIQTHLGLSNPTLFSTSFDRPNLSLEVMGNLPKKEKVKQIIDFIQARSNDSGIIYCLSRKETEEWCTTLQNNGIQAAFYHAGLPADERAQVQEDFVNDEIPVICATIAFGMGIDKSNVRWVIHTNLPKNMEGYYQEIGRAGRDGMPSITRLYYNYRDVILLKDFASQSDQQEVLIEKLNRMLQYAEASSCRRRILL
ncbi:MAG: ATP-dependent DNA helicase RecQ, partial [Crocinitomicaceae bacterium]